MDTLSTGARVGRLTLQQFERVNGRGVWACVCECGTERVIRCDSLKSGRTTSCGCRSVEVAKTFHKTHGHARPRSHTYSIWAGMHNRCKNPKQKEYPRYGGRGIYVCTRWGKFENFLADMGEKPEDHWIDRKDNDGPYSPDNCEWKLQKQQARNTSKTVWLEFGGERLSLPEWAERASISALTLRTRLRRGWTLERALSKCANHPS